MDTATKPILTTTSMSFFIHGLVFAGLVLVYEGLTIPDEGVGRGVDIQLISSVQVSDQQESDVPHKQETVESVSPERLNTSGQKTFSEKMLTAFNNAHAMAVVEPKEEAFTENDRFEQQFETIINQLNDHEDASVASVPQATSASQQQHSIIELLHSRISDNKKYPYLARRQRREGTTTIAFVLHPDGRLENAHLVSSSQTVALDRAALAAVKNIEPFADAQKYIEQAKEFQIDVVFDLL